jgi:anti-sigma factor RsiW
MIVPVTLDNERRMLDYLLGNLDAGERAELERIYFSDQELFEHLCALEDELIDRSLSGQLSEEDKRLFAAQYLEQPHLRQKVEFARALKDAAMSLEAESTPRRVASPVHAPTGPSRRQRTAALWCLRSPRP